MRSGSKEQGRKSLREFLETEIWPQIPDELLDREPMSKEKIEEILGFGEGECDSRQFRSDRCGFQREAA
jgi:hypothetical protein